MVPIEPQHFEVDPTFSVAVDERGYSITENHVTTIPVGYEIWFYDLHFLIDQKPKTIRAKVLTNIDGYIEKAVVWVVSEDSSTRKKAESLQESFLGLSLRLWKPEYNFRKYYYVDWENEVKIPRKNRRARIAAEISGWGDLPLHLQNASPFTGWGLDPDTSLLSDYESGHSFFILKSSGEQPFVLSADYGKHPSKPDFINHRNLSDRSREYGDKKYEWVLSGRLSNHRDGSSTLTFWKDRGFFWREQMQSTEQHIEEAIPYLFEAGILTPDQAEVYVFGPGGESLLGKFEFGEFIPQRQEVQPVPDESKKVDTLQPPKFNVFGESLSFPELSQRLHTLPKGSLEFRRLKDFICKSTDPVLQNMKQRVQCGTETPTLRPRIVDRDLMQALPTQQMRDRYWDRRNSSRRRRVSYRVADASANEIRDLQVLQNFKVSEVYPLDRSRTFVYQPEELELLFQREMTTEASWPWCYGVYLDWVDNEDWWLGVFTDLNGNIEELRPIDSSMPLPQEEQVMGMNVRFWEPSLNFRRFIYCMDDSKVTGRVERPEWL